MIGTRMKQLRRGSRLTSSQVARYLHIDLKLYILIESGEVTVTGEIIEKLCALYGCKEKVLYDENEKLVCHDMHALNEASLEKVADVRKLYARYVNVL
ncbi:helix-turn-helix transcriptional regulator [uncultured Traorella sp.]|uniref:helix-turn-helix transcriptional regulator n=1 Tax=uncultured Traorella sp. TaxID=1929048 RepID=UPI0025FF7C1F|nr:helix-turn-helix transcriptional regulator [uncultured Traorella sp.]